MLEIPQLLGDTTAVTSFLPSILFDGNFHTVSEGRFYRSGELPPEALRQKIERFGIKTLINLSRREEEPMTPNGPTERELAHSLGVEYFQIPLNGKRIPSRDRIAPLLKVFDLAPRPILVHCTSGTHRSGVASAIWLLEEENESFEDAKSQLSLRYGYIHLERQLASIFSGKQTIDRLLWEYERAALVSPQRFSDWVYSGSAPYDPSDELQNQCSTSPIDLFNIESQLLVEKQAILGRPNRVKKF